MPEDWSDNLTNITKPKRRISEPFIITTCTKTEGGTTYGTCVEQTVIQLAPFEGIPIPESGKIGNRKPVSPTLTTNPLYTVPSYSHLACGSRRFFRVYLGVRTCEHFLCVAPFVFLGSIVFTSLFSSFTSPVSLTGSYTEVEPFFRRVKQEQKKAQASGLALSTLWETSLFTDTVFVMTNEWIKSWWSFVSWTNVLLVDTFI